MYSCGPATRPDRSCVCVCTAVAQPPGLTAAYSSHGRAVRWCCRRLLDAGAAREPSPATEEAPRPPSPLLRALRSAVTQPGDPGAMRPPCVRDWAGLCWLPWPESGRRHCGRRRSRLRSTGNEGSQTVSATVRGVTGVACHAGGAKRSGHDRDTSAACAPPAAALTQARMCVGVLGARAAARPTPGARIRLWIVAAVLRSSPRSGQGKAEAGLPPGR
jgi:hypothetical protein